MKFAVMKLALGENSLYLTLFANGSLLRNRADQILTYDLPNAYLVLSYLIVTVSCRQAYLADKGSL